MNTFAPPSQLPSFVLPPYGISGPAGMDLDTSPALPRLGNIVRRRWVSIALWSFAFMIGAGAIGLRLPQVYTAKAQVVISPPASSSKPGGPERVDEIATTIETEVSTLGSRDLLGQVLDRLVTTPNFPIATFSRQGRLQLAARGLAAWLLEGEVGAWVEHNAAPGQAAGLRALAAPPNPAHERESILDQLERNLKINSEPRSRVISVRYAAPDADLAALVVNTVIAAYIAAQEDRKRDNLQRDLAWLDKHLPQQRADMEAATAALSAFRMDHAVQDPADVDQQDQQAIVLKRKLKTGQDSLAALEVERAALSRLRDGPTPSPVVTRFSPLLATLQQQEQALGGEPAPQAGDEAFRLRAAIVAEVDAAILRLDDEVAMLTARQTAFGREVARMELNLRGAQPAANHLRQLIRLTEAKRQVYEEGLLRQQNLAQAQDLVSADATMLSAAAPPQTPTSANPILFLPPALVLGLILGGCLAVWRDGRDTTLRNARNMQGVLGLTAVGFMPMTRRRWPAMPKAAAGSALRQAALRALFAATMPYGALRHGRKVVLVTSSVSGEDGRELARSLADVAAGLLPRVLLVALDRQDLPLIPVQPVEATAPDGATPVPGMCLTQPGAPGLPDVLTATGATRDPMGLIVSEQFPEALHRLRETYDCVVIQAGPMLESGEAALLATEADRILLAVRWGHTPRPTVENALAILSRSEGSPFKPGAIVAVLTRVNVRRHLAYRFGDAIEAMARAYRGRPAA